MTTLRQEAFLDQEKIESYSGVSFGVNRPVKYSGNPIWPSLPEADINHNIGYTSGAFLDGETVLWPTVWNTPGGGSTASNPVLAYAVADENGVSFSRPSLGLISYGGSTNNNILIQTPVFARVTYEPSLTATPFVAVGATGVSTGVEIWTAAEKDGPFTHVKSIPPGFQCESNAIWRRTDLRWVIYCQVIGTGTRQIGMWLSDTTDLTGAWTYQGIVISGTSVAEMYHAGAWKHGELVYVPVGVFNDSAIPPAGTFNGTDNRIWKARLYVTRADDGATFTLADDEWIASTGVYGEWDGGEIVVGNTLIEIGDEWRLYYGGDTNTHHQEPEGDRLLGLATVPRGRVGYIEGPGEVVLTEINALEAASLELNSEGTITVELLDTDDQVIPGYSRTDSVPITADAYDNPVTWDDHDVTPADFKTVLVLAAGARAYYLTAADAEAEPPPDLPDVGLTLDESSIWEQTGTSITARALTGRRSTVTAIAYSENGGAIWGDGEHTDRFDIDGESIVGESAIVLEPGVPLNVELGVTPQDDDEALTIRIGVPL